MEVTMPYCNQCGRYIGGGLLCQWCTGDTPQEAEGSTASEVPCTVTEDEVVPENIGITPTEETVCEEGEGSTGEVSEEAFEETEAQPPAEETPSAESRGREGLRRVRASVGDFAERAGGAVREIFSGDARTEREPRQNRVMAVLSYMSLLWVVPYLVAGRTPYTETHLARGLTFLLLDCLGLTLGGIAFFSGVIMPPAMPLFAGVAEVILLISLAGRAWSVVRCVRTCRA